MSDSVRLQCSIGGFAPAGAAVDAITVLGEMDLPTGVLLIDIARTVQRGRPEVRVADSVVCTNNPASEDRDVLFTGEDIRAAIEDYFDFNGRGLLVLEGSTERLNPSAKIEPDGIDERGRKYRFAPDITNGQIAIIALCWLARRHGTHAEHVNNLDDFAEAQSLYSIGLGGRPSGQDSYVMGAQVRLGPNGWPE